MMQRLLCCLMILTPCFVQAQTTELGPYELTPYGAFSAGGTFTVTESDAEVELEDSGSFGLIFNIRERANTQWEILYSQQKTDADVRGLDDGDEVLDMTVHYLHFGGTYQGEGKVVKPYLAATIGATHFNISDAGYDNDTFFSFAIGPGLQIRPNERLGLRLEARVFGTLVRSSSDLFCISDPGNETAGCAIRVDGEVLWQAQMMAGVVFRF